MNAAHTHQAIYAGHATPAWMDPRAALRADKACATRACISTRCAAPRDEKPASRSAGSFRSRTFAALACRLWTQHGTRQQRPVMRWLTLHPATRPHPGRRRPLPTYVSAWPGTGSVIKSL